MIMNKYCYINNCIPKCGKIIGISENRNYLIKLWRLNIETEKIICISGNVN
jgi:hypothetical protein